MARVLVVAQDATAIAPVCAELMRRGAALGVVNDIRATTEAVQANTYDTILVHAREGAPETLLLLQLIKAQAVGSPKILLLINPDTASAVLDCPPVLPLPSSPLEFRPQHFTDWSDNSAHEW